MAGGIGFYICDCGTNIAGVVDCAGLAARAGGLAGVRVAREYPYLCSDPGQKMIRADIEELGLERVVVAACSPRMHEHTFRRTLSDAGLNPFLLEIANIREQCSWVTGEPGAATDKAWALAMGAIRRATYLEPLTSTSFPVTDSALVIGAGIAGIHAALAIAAAGRKVYLVERGPSIGGHMAMLDKTFPTLDCSACILTPKMVEASRSGLIETMTLSEVTSLSGFKGNFKAVVKTAPRYVDVDRCTACGDCVRECSLAGRVSSEFEAGLSNRSAIYIPFPQAVPLAAAVDPGSCLYLSKGKCKKQCSEACGPGAIDLEQEERETEVEVGAVVVATGFDLYDCSLVPRLGYGRYPEVLDALQFERILSASGPTGGRIETPAGEAPKRIAFVHCVGSRDESANEYCSRVCCMYTVKQAHMAREKGLEVYEFYIDVNAFGRGCQEFYRRVRDEGVYFIRGRAADVARIGGELRVFAEDTLLSRQVEMPVDMVVLAAGLVPPAGTPELARTLGIPVGTDGFLMEAHPKLRPVETVKEGVFLAGCCQGPKDIPDTVAQAGSAAACALALLSSDRVEVEPLTARVIEELCTGCASCETTCPSGAIEIVDGIAVVTAAECGGCGVCAAGCVRGAVTVANSTDEQVLANIEGILEVGRG